MQVLARTLPASPTCCPPLTATSTRTFWSWAPTATRASAKPSWRRHPQHAGTGGNPGLSWRTDAPQHQPARGGRFAPRNPPRVLSKSKCRIGSSDKYPRGLGVKPPSPEEEGGTPDDEARDVRRKPLRFGPAGQITETAPDRRHDMHVGMGRQRRDLAGLVLGQEALFRRPPQFASSAASRAVSKAVRRPDFS